jgi:hypothetical protein
VKGITWIGNETDIVRSRSEPIRDVDWICPALYFAGLERRLIAGTARRKIVPVSNKRIRCGDIRIGREIELIFEGAVKNLTEVVDRKIDVSGSSGPS